MEKYIHGYGTPEQERLIAQAAHWRDELILPGTDLPPGTRLLEVGCGVGAVLAVLAEAFPGIEISGVDIEERQIEFAREYLGGLGVSADLRQADALALPFADASFDHVWMMWLLEHVQDPVAALREARRVLVPGGAITAIEVDYNTTRVTPTTDAIDALLRAMIEGMEASGRSDAGTHLPRWLEEAGFGAIDPGERVCRHEGDAIPRQANYFAEIWEGAFPSLNAAAADLRELHTKPGARLDWVIHVSRAKNLP